MLRYKVTREDGKTVIETCSVREFFGSNSPAPPGTQIIEMFDPKDPDCRYNKDYEYTFPDNGEEEKYIDLVCATIKVPDNKGGFHEVCRIQPMEQILLDNPSISITPAHPNKLPQESTNLQSTEDLNLSVDSKSNDNKTMVHNASMHQRLCIQMEDEFDKQFRTKKVKELKLRNRISSAVLQIIEEEKKEECAAKSEIESLQPVSPSKMNRSLEAKDSKLNSANSNNFKKLVLPTDVENQINSLVSSIIEKFFATTKQPGNNQVGTQQATTSKQSVVSQSNR